MAWGGARTGNVVVEDLIFLDAVVDDLFGVLVYDETFPLDVCR